MLQNCTVTGFADEIGPMIDEQIDLLKKLDVKYIELRSANHIGIADYTIEQAKDLKKVLDANGIRISSLGSPIGKIMITDDFEPHFEKFKNVVALTRVFETPFIRMFSFFIPKGEDPYKYRDEVMARMERFVAYAKEQGVVLLHENEKDIYGDNADRCRELFDRFYCDNFRCVFDFANFVQVGQDTLDAYEKLEKFIAYIHVKDALKASGTVVPAGQGDGHVEEIFRMLDEKGYSGYLSLEPHLAEFETFRKLEKGSRELTENSGVWSYSTAHAALMKLLEK